tara:strand:+ start:44 stop:256 length:213 start_codon:yes stop_codon:yes gene_type:complete
MSWWNIIKARGIGGGPPKDRKRKPRYGTTTPKGSYYDRLNKLVNRMLSGKISEAEYKKEKEKLEKERDGK